MAKIKSMRKALIIIVLVVVGVIHELPLRAAPLSPPLARGGEGGVVVRDDAGRRVTVPLPVRRVVTLAPSNTAIVAALGMTASIVGASTTDDNPLPGRVKRVGAVNPSIEEIVALSPGLVLGIYGEDALCDRLRRLGVPCVIMSDHSIDDVMRDIMLAGRLLSADTRASAVVDGMKQKLDRARAVLERCRTTPLVYIEIDASDPSRPFSAGRGSFMDSLITMAHAHNIAHDTRTPWPRLSQEYIIAENPDVIVVTDGLTIDGLKKRPGWSGIKAVETGRVYGMSADLVSRPGPGIVDAFVALAKDVHPEAFGK